MKKRYEFRPDPNQLPWRVRLFLTKKQRLSLLKWGLYALMMVLLSLTQDVIMSEFALFGGTTDLVPCGILLICLLQSPESGGIFALIASSLYVFSGSAQGYYCIVLLTFLSVVLNILRHALLSKRFGSIYVCIIVGLFVYELTVFIIGMFTGQTYFSRVTVPLMTGILSIAVVPALYPLGFFIGKIGGEKWKD